MTYIQMDATDAANIPIPAIGSINFFIDPIDGAYKGKNSDGDLVAVTTTVIAVQGEFIDNAAAITGGLETGDVYSLPYVALSLSSGYYPLAIVGDVVP